LAEFRFRPALRVPDAIALDRFGCRLEPLQQGISMTQHNHQTAPTQFVEANGVRFAYRRFGNAAGVSLVFNQHFTGTMDHWGPAVTDGFAKDREVILFNNAGASSSSREVPTRIEKMGANAVAFIRALGLTKFDVLGFSIGGFVAQEIALQATDLVRRLVLVGTGPRGGEGMATLTPEAQKIFGASYDKPDHLWLRVHFTESEQSQAAGHEFLRRFRLRPRIAIPKSTRQSRRPRSRRSANGGAAGEAVRISEVDPPADTGRERGQGRDHLLHELVHPATAPA
jgi:pimeloyl-ACP methyl ester carboxylesterase